MFKRHKYKIYTVLLLIISSLVSLHAQEKKIRFQYITSDQGLSHNMIDCMLLDSKGFMWFGTWNGLNRFDGYNFTVYKRDPRNSGSLSGNFIYDLAEDKEGNIWIGTENGLNVYLYQYDSFIHYNKGKTPDAGISSDRIQVVFNDRNGFLWIGTDKGLDRLTIGPNGQINNFCHYHASENSDGLTFNSVTSIYEDQKGNLWLGTWGGDLHLFDQDKSKNGGFIQFQKSQADTNSLVSNYVACITEDRFGNLWIGTLGGIDRYNPQKRTFEHFSGNIGSFLFYQMPDRK